LERVLAAEASRVVFTCQEAAQDFLARRCECAENRVAYLEHPVVEVDPVCPQGSGAEEPHLLYTGSFYGRRTPFSLLAALLALRTQDPPHPLARARLLHVGPAYPPLDEELADERWRDVYTNIPAVSYREATRLMQRADALVVIDAPSEGPSPFLPSKLSDYLAAKRPVIALTPAGSATERVLRELGVATAVPDCTEAVLDLLSAPLRDKMPEAPAEKYSLAAFARRLNRIYLSAMGKTG
jgi:hypothetical protein